MNRETKSLIFESKRELNDIHYRLMSYASSIVYQDHTICTNVEKLSDENMFCNKMISTIYVDLDSNISDVDIDIKGVAFLKIDSSKSERNTFSFDQLVNEYISQCEIEKMMIQDCISTINKCRSVNRDLLFTLLVTDEESAKQKFKEIYRKSERSYQRYLQEAYLEYAKMKNIVDIEKLLKI